MIEQANAVDKTTVSPKAVVSIIVPAFNAAKFLSSTLRSLQAQSFTDFEVIVIDDGSTDDTGTIADQFAVEDRRFRVIRQQNRGASAARNHGILFSVGQYLSFFDADDIMYSSSLEVRVKAINAPDSVDIVYADHDWIDANDRVWSTSDDLELSDQPVHDFLRSPCIGIQGVLLRRELFARTGLFDTSFTHVEDWELWIRCAKAGAKFRHVHQRLDGYRRHESNITLSHNKMLEQGLKMLYRHRPPNGDRMAKRAWRQGKFGLMRGWIWAEWRKNPNCLRAARNIMRASFHQPALLIAFARVISASVVKRINRPNATNCKPLVNT